MTATSPPLALQTFEIAPTPSTLPVSQTVDELMIDWGNVPAGSSANIYLPAVSADDILALASSMYVTHCFSRIDAHTLACTAGGISYLPIPKSSGANYAGLLSISLPNTIGRGQNYSVTIRQVAAVSGRAQVGNTPGALANTAVALPPASWRRVLGTFQISLSVKTQSQALFAAERLYSVLLWIEEAIPPANRWYPVFLRYLALLAGVILGYGGKPGQIQPSPSGQLPGLPAPKPLPPPVKGEELELVGKIAGIIYDHFGDFAGFILETETGEHHRFTSREAPMCQLVRHAWIERTRVAVVAERHQPHVPRSIVLLTGGPGFAAGSV